MGIIPVLAVGALLFLWFFVFTEKGDGICEKVGNAGLMFIIVGIVTALTWLVLTIGFDIVDSRVSSVRKDAVWYVKSVKPASEVSRGSKGSIHTSNQFHFLVDMNDGTSRVMSVSMHETRIREANEPPQVVRYITSRTNRAEKIIFGCLLTKNERESYEIVIPVGTIVQQYQIM